VLTAWTVLLVVAATTFAAVRGFELSGGDRSTLHVTPASSTSTTTVEVPRAGQTKVSGTVTGLHVEDAVLVPRRIPTPFTVDAERGFGNGATIVGGRQNGNEIVISWNAGRPLPVSGGGGALIPDPVVLDLAPDGIRVGLGDVVCDLAPGTYTISSPVAVGQSGVAQERDSVTFEATPQTRVQFKGAPSILQTGPVNATGPGKVVLTGDLTVTTAAGSRTVEHLEMAKGAFTIAIARSGAGFRISATLQGTVGTS
jgi:hypothetical protein